MNADDIRFIDLFGGIGGFRLGLENASDKFKCVDYIEYDKYAVKSYNEIFQEEHKPRDVTELSTKQIPEHDLICAGFPCQAFSVAGNRKGTDEARGKLFREIVRIAEAHRPEMLLLENVKGLLSQKAVKDGESIRETKGHAFTEILQALHELGYCLEWRVLNSKNWGVPQNRERVFIIGHLGGEPGRKIFPLRREDREDTREDGESGNINNIGNVNPSGRGMNGKVYEASQSTVMPTVSTNKGEGHKILNHQFRPETRPSIKDGQSGGSGLLYNSEYSYALSSSPHYAVIDDYNSKMKYDGNTGTLTQNFGANPLDNGNKLMIQPCLTPSRVDKRQNGRRFKDDDDPMFTLTGQDIHGVKQEKRIRKLTPKECWRLQGFPDWAFEKAEQVNSDTQLYKQAGNSVTVNVIEALGEGLQKSFSI